MATSIGIIINKCNTSSANDLPAEFPTSISLGGIEKLKNAEQITSQSNALKRMLTIPWSLRKGFYCRMALINIMSISTTAFAMTLHL
jgi:hypothetical protein